MAMPTPLEELEPASDDELLPPCRPRFAGSGMRGLPSRRARLGGGTSVSNSANAISSGVWKAGSKPESSSSLRMSSTRSSCSRRRRARRRRRVTNRTASERRRMCRCLCACRRALRAALLRFRAFGFGASVPPVPSPVLASARPTAPAAAVEAAGAGADPWGCLVPCDALRIASRRPPCAPALFVADESPAGRPGWARPLPPPPSATEGACGCG